MQIKDIYGKILFEDTSKTLRKCLENAVLQDAYLRGANLQGANLQGAYLQGAYLQGAYLRFADLRSAYLQGANLRFADLRFADLRFADLRSAYLQFADLPSPAILLLADWCNSLSNSLIADLMEYDASCHPDRQMFDRWAAGGQCPYFDIHIQRAANFTERKELWGKGKLCGAFELMTRLFQESGIKR